MTHEADLIAEAHAILGPDEEVLGAGYFSLANIVAAQLAGRVAGTVAAFDLTNSPVADAFLTILGGRAATHAAAEGQGVTVTLLVAVTPEVIHVLNRDTGGRLKAEVATFRRDAVDVHIAKFGLSRHLTLTDRESGASIELHGSVSFLSAQAEGDKVVFDLLAT